MHDDTNFSKGKIELVFYEVFSSQAPGADLLGFKGSIEQIAFIMSCTITPEIRIINEKY